MIYWTVAASSIGRLLHSDVTLTTDSDDEDPLYALQVHGQHWQSSNDGVLLSEFGG